MRSVVVLPAPFGRSRPNTSPALTSKLTESTAVTSLNLLLRLLTRITCALYSRRARLRQLPKAYHQLRMTRDELALDSHRLLPRLLRNVDRVDSSVVLAGLELVAPLLPLAHSAAEGMEPGPAIVPAAELLANRQRYRPASCVAGLSNDSMGNLIRLVRELAGLGVAAIALDLSNQANTPPYGDNVWRPRSREELAELRGAAGVPFWLSGIASADDADVALEAGLDAVVVHSDTGRLIGGPAVIEVLPEVVDAVAGTMDVLAGGLVGLAAVVLTALGSSPSARTPWSSKVTAAWDTWSRSCSTRCGSLAARHSRISVSIRFTRRCSARPEATPLGERL